MKHTYYALLILMLLYSCQNADTTTSRESVDAEQPVVQEPVAYHTYYSNFVGSFDADNEKVKDPAAASYSNRINIKIQSLEKGKALGRSVIAGNDRPFEGTYTQDKEKFKIVAKEPGDDAHDGRFEFTLDTVKQELSGKWYSNDTGIAVPVRLYTLSKKEFVYKAENQVDESIIGAAFFNQNANENTEGEGYEAVTKAVLKHNASTTKLTKKHVENLYKGDLEIIRNAIYARHGYSFRNRRMRYMFDNYVSWYVPVSIDVRAELTELEKENIALLKRYEDHAGKYYDEFSR